MFLCYALPLAFGLEPFGLDATRYDLPLLHAVHGAIDVGGRRFVHFAHDGAGRGIHVGKALAGRTVGARTGDEELKSPHISAYLALARV